MASAENISIKDRIACDGDKQSKATKPPRLAVPPLPDENRDKSIKPTALPIPPLPDENTASNSPSTVRRTLRPPPPLDTETDESVKHAIFTDKSIKPTAPPIPPLPDENTAPNSPSTVRRTLRPPPPLDTETDESAKQQRPPIPPIPKGITGNKKEATPRGKSKLPPPPSFTPEEIPVIPPRSRASKENKEETNPPIPPLRPKSTETTEESPPIPPHRPKSSETSDAKCLIKVTGFDATMYEEALRQHFESKAESGGGPIKTIRVRNGAALIRFEQEEVAKRVLNHEQTLGQQVLKVEPVSAPVQNARHSDTMKPSSFLVSGMSPSTSKQSLRDFLQSKTTYTVESFIDVCKDHVSVTFTPESKPDLTELQMTLQSAKLDDKHLHIEFMPEEDDDDDENDYMEPMVERDVQITGEIYKYLEFFKKGTIQSRLNKVHVTATFDSEHFTIKLKGKRSDLEQGEKCLKNVTNNLVILEETIVKPGIETFLESDEAKKEISEVEKEEHCAIFVSGSIYETCVSVKDDDVFTDSDSNPSGGSVQSASVSAAEPKTNETTQESGVPVEGDYVLLHSTANMGKFKIGACQFHLKKGKVEEEDVACAVNVTNTDLEQGDLWSVLKESDQRELQRQLNMKTLLSEWSKKGIVMSTTSALPYQFIIHVSLKNSGGDLRKAIRKTFQMAQNYSDITSIAFYKKVGPDEDPCPRFLLNYVDEINKYQKTARPGIKDIRLVLDRMDDSYVTGVRQELENLLAASKKHGLKHNLLNMIPKRLRSQSSPPDIKAGSENLQIYIRDPNEQKADPSQRAQTVDEAQFSLVGAEIMVLLCSESGECNDKAWIRFMEFCEANMQPKIVDNPKIKLLTETQIKLFRKKAGRRVEVEVKSHNGTMEIRGYRRDVDSVYAKLKVELEGIQDTEVKQEDSSGSVVPQNDHQVERPVTVASKQTAEASNADSNPRQEDEYDIFGKHIACELRGIPDHAKRSKVKRDIQRVIFDATE